MDSILVNVQIRLNTIMLHIIKLFILKLGYDEIILCTAQMTNCQITITMIKLFINVVITCHIMHNNVTECQLTKFLENIMFGDFYKPRG